MKNCPNCLSKLEVNTKTKSMSYVCTNCGTRSLDIEFLKEHVKAPDWNKYLTNKRATRIREDRGCSKPKCKIKAFNLDFDGDGKAEVELDICYSCNQVMFDLHEFDKIKEYETFSVDTSLPQQFKTEIEKIRTQDGEAIPRHLSFAVNTSDFAVNSVFSSYQLHGWKFLLGLIALPIESQNRIRRLPAVTYGLMALISVVSLYCIFFDQALMLKGGFLPAEPFRFSGVTLITTFFLHANLSHLIGNMYSMYIFGDNIEDKIGRAPYILLIALGALAGVAMHFSLTEQPEIPLVGASTGISSLITFYALSFPGTKFSVLLGWLIWIRIPAMVYVLLWVLLQFAGAFAILPGVSAVSFASHVGGILVGLAFWLYYQFKHNKKA
ncbi:MAG: rhomboid family intramembrane serine protease [Bdellovibrionales bacterium]|nr:rhomboid family intramembrane serine protease [Bdellovibrionales bacterium]